MLTRLTAPTTYPVTTERAKERLKFDDSDNDSDLTALIAAATAALEMDTGLMLSRQTWEYRTDCWQISIPGAPFRDVLSVHYLDADHVEQDIDAANYYWERTSQGADLHFISGYSVPTLSNRDGAIRIVFEVGYDDGASGTGDDPHLVLPDTVELCILFLVGHWTEFRELGSTDDVFKVPNTFEFLSRQLKVYR